MSPSSGRKSTYRLVQIREASSVFPMPIDIMKPFLEMIEKADRSMPRPNGSDKAPTFESPLEH
jgi:hypothetical protein